MKEVDQFRADDLEGLQIVNHVRVDHGTHLDLVVLRIDQVLVVREVDEVRAGLPP